MKPLFKSYLKKVCWMISKKNRKSTYMELRAHLLDEFDHLSQANENEEETLKSVLKNKPNPYWLGYKMRRSQHCFLRRNFISLSVVFGFMLFLMAGHILVEQVRLDYIELSKKYRSTEKNENEFENDLKFLKEHQDQKIFFTERKSSADEFVYKTLEFSKVQVAADLYKNYSYQLRADKKILAQIKNMNLDWVEEFKKFDFVSGLSFEDKERFQQNMQNSMIRKIGVHASAKGPMFLGGEVADAVRLYALQQCLADSCERGFSVLRQFAKILYSSNNWYSQIVAINLLKKENQWVKKFNFKNYNALDSEFLNANERVSWGWSGVLGDMFSKQTFSARWQPYMKAELGLCGSVSNSPFGSFLARSDLIGEKFFFEEDYSHQIQSEKKMLGALFEKCDMQIYSDLIHTKNSKQTTLGYAAIFPEDLQLWIDEASIPYVRQWIGLGWAQYSTNNYWRIYERLPPKVATKEKNK